MSQSRGISRPKKWLTIGLVFGAIAAAAIAIGWMFLKPTNEQESIESTLQQCADLFDARQWEGLSHYAWPQEQRAEVARTLESRVPKGFTIKRPVELDAPVLDGDKATVVVKVQWSLAMGRIRDNGRLSIDLIRHDNKWYVDASDMRRWWP